ncbi:MAG: non-heme iron oxygenase ferredoxin subunit [Longimicrobiales bacterium]|nr:non-heme iron oxygenase ferredoxin subunit [Longimicrobiales bacterium]
MAEWVRVASLSDVPAGTLRGVFAKMRLLVLANVDGDVYALEDRCSHQEFPLSDGELDGSDLVCIHHGARFDACTGKNKGLPAVRPVNSFPVEIRDGEIYVEV